MKKTAEKTEKNTEKTAIYNRYLKAFRSEGKAINKTSDMLDIIFALGLSPREFYTELFAEGYTTPKEWKLNKKGLPLSPSSTVVRQAIPAVNRLVSAYDMRNKRTKDAEKLATETVDVQVIPPTEAPEKPAAAKTEKVDSAPRVETSDEDITFDAVDMIRNLQGFMVALSNESLELSATDSKRAHKLAKELIELAQNA